MSTTTLARRRATNPPPGSALAPRLLALVLFAACAAPAPEATASSRETGRASGPSGADGAVVRGALGRELDEYLTRLETFGMHGAILVEKDGEVVLKKGYGIADHATGAPITAGTLFHLGSLGKQFTAAAVMTLVMQGEVELDAPIATYLADVPADKQAITVHQLLTHTAGLPYLPGEGPALELPLQSPPGERWSYSNPGYTLLADVVEAVSGQDFHAYVREHVFEPAGLVQTFALGVESGDQGAMAHAYTDDTDQGRLEGSDPSHRFRGAGDFVSSLDDLYRWERCLREHCVMSPELTERMFSEQARNPGSRTGYGYGWMVTETIRGTRLVHHGGNLGGFNTDYRRYVDEGLTVVFLSNHFVSGRSMRDAVMNNVSLLVNGGDPAQPPPVAPPRTGASAEPDRLARFAGRYRAGAGELVVAAEGGALSVRTESAELAGALFNPALGDEDRDFLAACLADSVSVLESALAGDSAPLLEHLSVSLEPAGAWGLLQQQLTAIEDGLGAVRAVEPVCAMQTGGPRSGKAFVRFEGERGAQLFQLTWSGGILHLATCDAVASQRFAPLAEPGAAEGGEPATELAAYNIFTGVAVPLSIAEDAGTATLTLRSSDGPITARRSS